MRFTVIEAVVLPYFCSNFIFYFIIYVKMFEEMEILWFLYCYLFFSILRRFSIHCRVDLTLSQNDWKFCILVSLLERNSICENRVKFRLKFLFISLWLLYFCVGLEGYWVHILSANCNQLRRLHGIFFESYMCVSLNLKCITKSEALQTQEIFNFQYLYPQLKVFIDRDLNISTRTIFTGCHNF